MTSGAISEDSKPLGGVGWWKQLVSSRCAKFGPGVTRVIGIHGSWGGWEGLTPQPRGGRHRQQPGQVQACVCHGTRLLSAINKYYVPNLSPGAGGTNISISKRCPRREGRPDGEMPGQIGWGLINRVSRVRSWGGGPTARTRGSHLGASRRGMTQPRKRTWEHMTYNSL